MELRYKVKKPETILRFLRESNIPMKIIDMENGKQKIYVNQSHKALKDTIKKGDHLSIYVVDEKLDPSVTPQDLGLDIQYEDDYVMIVSKPENMQIMVSKAHPEGTLANAIQYHYVQHGIQSEIHFVNRLDKESSGIVLVAKNRFIKYLLGKMEDSITREYYAILDGILDQKKMCIDLPISRIENSILREVSMQGEECSTSFQVAKEFGRFSLIKVLSETGRTHQIRVHFSHFSYPIVGDELYNKKSYSTQSLMLYSYRISFIHPITDQTVSVAMDLPESFQKFMKEHNA